MRRFLLPGLVASAAVALLLLLAFGVARTAANTSLEAQLAKGIDPVAPASYLRLPILGRQGTEDLADLRGKVVVVNMFASWCDNCAAEAGALDQTQKEIAGRGGTVLGITYLDASLDSERYVKVHDITYPVLRDVDQKFGLAYGTSGVPETYVINRQGRVVAVARYQVTASWLKSTVAPLLKHT